MKPRPNRTRHQIHSRVDNLQHIHHQTSRVEHSQNRPARLLSHSDDRVRVCRGGRTIPRTSGRWDHVIPHYSVSSSFPPSQKSALAALAWLAAAETLNVGRPRSWPPGLPAQFALYACAGWRMGTTREAVVDIWHCGPPRSYPEYGSPVSRKADLTAPSGRARQPPTRRLGFPSKPLYSRTDYNGIVQVSWAGGHRTYWTFSQGPGRGSYLPRDRNRRLRCTACHVCIHLPRATTCQGG